MKLTNQAGIRGLSGSSGSSRSFAAGTTRLLQGQRDFRTGFLIFGQGCADVSEGLGKATDSVTQVGCGAGGLLRRLLGGLLGCTGAGGGGGTINGGLGGATGGGADRLGLKSLNLCLCPKTVNTASSTLQNTYIK